MAGAKYLTNTSGDLTEVVSSQTSAGAGDAGKVVALNSTGTIDITMLPTGVGPDTATIVASESLAAGAFVNVWNNTGTPNVRNADASTTGKQADGFVLSAFSSSGSAVVYLFGNNNQITGAIGGRVWLSDTTPGGYRATAPTGSGKISQIIGTATSATSINFEAQRPIVLV